MNNRFKRGRSVFMAVYCGFKREMLVEAAVIDLGAGAGAIACLECGGTGWWAFMEPEIPGHDCVDCKGTGRQLVSVA